jgi:hypothetical protein
MGQSFSMERFVTNPLRPNRPPVSGQAGLQALAFAESIDGYVGLVEQSAINRLARAGQTYMPWPHSINREVPNASPSDPWPSGQVVWMDPSADSGLPHTRAPNYICISKDFPEASFANTLLHERVHVSQRLHPSAWEKLLADTWDMKPWYGFLPTDIQARRRINPDLLLAPLYIWKEAWVPLGLFKSTGQPKLNEIDVVWWNTTQRILTRQPPPGWNEFFGNVPAGEHPFELIAYLVAANPSQNQAYNAIKSRLGELPTSEV